MVSATHHDCLTDASGVVQKLFENFAKTSENDSDFPTAVFDHFRRAFADPDALNEVSLVLPLTAILTGERQIPPLDVHHTLDTFKPHALVRFRGMVQDTSYSPEMYIAVEGVDAAALSAGWGLGTAQEVTPQNMQHIKDCTVLWAVTPPGQAPWMSDLPIDHGATPICYTFRCV